jgi:hypothetical protein
LTKRQTSGPYLSATVVVGLRGADRPPAIGLAVRFAETVISTIPIMVPAPDEKSSLYAKIGAAIADMINPDEQ